VFYGTPYQSAIFIHACPLYFQEWLLHEGHTKELVDLGQKPSQFSMPIDDFGLDQNGIGARSSSQQSV